MEAPTAAREVGAEPASAEQKQQQQQNLLRAPYIYKPESSDTLLDHATAMQLKYRDRPAKDIELAMQSNDIKSLVNDVSFLTSKARYGDLVVYIGNNIGAWLPVAAKMFPTLQFLVYDGNPAKLIQLQERDYHLSGFPSNIHIRPCWFSDHEAENLVNLKFPNYNAASTLVIAETRNMVYDKKSCGPVIKNCVKDMADQDSWIHILKPRSASLKFDMPYQGGKHYSYLAGEMHLQVGLVCFVWSRKKKFKQAK